ncbi:lytic murein transglycosylase B [Oceanobacter sp. 5_MG-2023]|uniref:lytic murein transglycosylase B n=1 Tax=Oceanobacter sp. 5_MG-2023 TaxID=3062645 RepID=UPI0026E35C12|nr:lytic murein transglycosylase B [Oceanobacter sp. 5_MG-2023]MDO6681824.1 lytic murein transglycosylase B [Oceanobacter sp. 5_MG-2023]
MTRLTRQLAKTCLVISLSGSALAYAGYDQHSRFNEFAAELEKEYQIPPAETRRWLAESKKLDSVLEAIARPAEKTLEWDSYQDIFLTSKRIEGGKAFMAKHAGLLAAAEQKYGIPKEIITAIIGVETFYGSRQGSYRVLDSLATLAFDYPKRPIFWRELKAFFSLAKEENLDPATVKGSYAGAMGYGQFIPTSFLAYAVDGDGDGQRDLWANPADAINSVANYFNVHGWRAHEPVVQRARVSGNQYQQAVNDNLKPKWTVAKLAAMGVSTIEPANAEDPASLVKLIGKQGAEFWLAHYNYYVITRYNHSRLYAMAVYQLSEALKQ